MHKPKDDIDAVVTWVDGDDAHHAAKRALALSNLRRFSSTSIPGGRSKTRFSDNGELRFCISSIRRFMPWIRTIFLLTDEQRPGFLTDAFVSSHDIRLVDHKEVFLGHEDALPTFNSQSIETAMFRIDGLSERFVYFNDDVFVLAPTGPEQFFDGDRIVLRGDWAALPSFGPARMLLSSVFNHVASWLGTVRSMAVLPQYRAARLAGFADRVLLAPHTPHPLRRATLRDYFERNPRAFNENIRHKFRDMEQFVPVGLANHLELARGTAVHSAAKDDVLLCFNRDSDATLERKLDALETGTDRFLCVQGLDNAKPEFQSRVMRLLRTRIGEA